MPKKPNQAANLEENLVDTKQASEQPGVTYGATGLAPEADASDEPVSPVEQAESGSPPENDPAHAYTSSIENTDSNQNTQPKPNDYPTQRWQQNGFTLQNGHHAAGQTDDKQWGQTMQTQTNYPQNSQPMNPPQWGNTTQRGGALQLLDFSEVKRWASRSGGIYLAVYGLSRSLGSLTVAGAGLGLLYYAMTGRSPLSSRTNGNRVANQGSRGVPGAGGLNAMHTSTDSSTTIKNIIVKAPLHEVYQAWANFENFPNFMQYIQSVNKTGERTSHWVMEGPFNTKIEWDAETTRLEDNKRIAWSSITGDIKTSGQVTFNQLSNNEVEVTVMLKYVPPAGLAGEIGAELFSDPEGKLSEDLRNFKRFIEQREPQAA